MPYLTEKGRKNKAKERRKRGRRQTGEGVSPAGALRNTGCGGIGAAAAVLSQCITRPSSYRDAAFQIRLAESGQPHPPAFVAAIQRAAARRGLISRDENGRASGRERVCETV